jgi:hypothetical protein
MSSGTLSCFCIKTFGEKSWKKYVSSAVRTKVFSPLNCGTVAAPDLEVLGGPVEVGEDPGIVTTDVEEKETPEVRVIVECVDHHLFGCDDCGEVTRLECQVLAELDLHRPGSLIC